MGASIDERWHGSIIVVSDVAVEVEVEGFIIDITNVVGVVGIDVVVVVADAAVIGIVIVGILAASVLDHCPQETIRFFS